MSTLKKGDLVMTPKGLGFVHEQQSESVFVRLLNGKNLALHIIQTSKATRAEVEAYLKENGFFSNGKGSYKYSSETNKYFTHSFNNTDWEVDLDSTLTKYDFDTAPEQLREAITMARLLNATKD